MKTTRRTYVLTVNGPSKKGLQLWIGKSVHALRHCPDGQMGQALRDMQRDVESVCPPVSPSRGSYSLNRGR